MNLVYARHESTPKLYVFQVPDGVTLEKGDTVKVRTKKGESIAKCADPSFEISERAGAIIARASGGQLPLAPVVAQLETVELRFEKESNPGKVLRGPGANQFLGEVGQDGDLVNHLGMKLSVGDIVAVYCSSVYVATSFVVRDRDGHGYVQGLKESCKDGMIHTPYQASLIQPAAKLKTGTTLCGVTCIEQLHF